MSVFSSLKDTIGERLAVLPCGVEVRERACGRLVLVLPSGRVYGLSPRLESSLRDLLGRAGAVAIEEWLRGALSGAAPSLHDEEVSRFYPAGRWVGIGRVFSRASVEG